MNLTEEEKDILDSFERGEWKSVKNLDAEKKRVREIARATMRKDKRVNIRISQRDLTELQRKAVHEGLPYQTFISSLLHKMVNGRLVDRTAH
jgi:predicted DNA binding CopG/RHH family protein